MPAILVAHAADVLNAEGYAGVHTRVATGRLGWPEEAPFDVVMATCAPSGVPRELTDQLADGGRMIAPIGPEGGVQKLLLIVKERDGLRTTEDLAVRFVPMVSGPIPGQK